MVMVSAVFYPLEHVRELLPKWRDYAVGSRRAQHARVVLERAAGRAVPRRASGKDVLVVAGAYAGSVDGRRGRRAAAARAGAAADRPQPWPWRALQPGFDALFPKGGLYYWKSRAVSELTSEAIETIADFAGRRPSPNTDIIVWHHGGAMRKVDESATAYGGRDAEFLVNGEASWFDPAQTDDALAWSREFWAAMGASTRPAGSTSRGSGEKEELVKAGYGANYKRLAELKAKFDPENLFRMNFNITPAAWPARRSRRGATNSAWLPRPKSALLVPEDARDADAARVDPRDGVQAHPLADRQPKEVDAQLGVDEQVLERRGDRADPVSESATISTRERRRLLLVDERGMRGRIHAAAGPGSKNAPRATRQSIAVK